MYPTRKSNYLRLVILIKATNHLAKMDCKTKQAKGTNESVWKGGDERRHRPDCLVARGTRKKTRGI